MKILFISKSYPRFGGVETWMDQVAAGLSACGHRVVIGLVKGRQWHSPDEYRTLHPGLCTVDIDGRYSTEQGRWLSVSRIIKRLNPDVVMPVMCRDALVGACKAKQAGLEFSLVLPLHAHNADAYYDVKLLGSFIDRVVCVDVLGTRIVSALCTYPKTHISIVEHGVRKAERPSQRDESTRLTVGYCGRLEDDQKRAGDLITFCEAVTQEGCELGVVVAGDGLLHDSLERGISSLPHLRSEFMGLLSTCGLYERFYPRIDILLCFSESETGPLVIWEAMQHGVVPVTSRYLGLKAAEFLNDDANCRVFGVGDLAEAASIVLDLSRNRSALAELSDRAAHDARERRSLDYMIERWDAVCSDIVNRETPRTPASHTFQSLMPASRRSLAESLRVPASLASLLRQSIRRPLATSSAGDEWPFYCSAPPRFAERIRSSASALEGVLLCHLSR